MFRNCEVLFGCFVIDLVLSATGRLASIYFVESMAQYNVERKQATLPYMLNVLIINLIGPVSGYLEQIFGMRFLIRCGCLMATVSTAACFFAEDILTITVLWGIILGMGHGLGVTLMPSLLNKHFPSDKSKSNGIMFSGGCIGGILLPPLIEISIRNYGFSGSFLILSAVVAQSIPASLLLNNHTNNASDNSSGKENISHTNEHGNAIKDINASNILPESEIKVENGASCQKLHNSFAEAIQNDCPPSELENKDLYFNNILRKERFPVQKNFSLQTFMVFLDPAFLIMLIINSGFIFIHQVLGTTIVDYVRDKGVKESLYVYYVMVLAVSDLVGRFSTGFILDKRYLPYAPMTSICYFSCSVFLLAFIFVKNYIMIMVCEIMMMVFYGAMVILSVSLVHEYIEEDKRTMATTCRYILSFPLILTILSAVGYFRGSKGSYDGLFFISVGISIFCGCLAYFIPYLSKMKQSKQVTDISYETT